MSRNAEARAALAGMNAADGRHDYVIPRFDERVTATLRGRQAPRLKSIHTT
jgi:hypothetical protein